MSWMSELDATRTMARTALADWETALMGDSDDAEYEAGLRLAMALRDFLQFTDQIAGGQPRQQTCEMDGYTEVGDQGDEQYWHCENPAIYRASVYNTDGYGEEPTVMLICAEHTEEFGEKTLLKRGDDSARAE